MKEIVLLLALTSSYWASVDTPSKYLSNPTNKKPGFQDCQKSALPLCFHGISAFITDNDKHYLKNQISLIISGGDFRIFTGNILHNHLSYVDQQQLDYLFGDPFYFQTLYPYLKLQWFKVFLLNQIVNSDVLPENAWLAWIDDDLVLNHPTSNGDNIFDRYIMNYGNQASVIITEDTNPWNDYPAASDFNTGVIIARKNSDARMILGQWWNLRPEDNDEQWEYDPPTQHGLKLLVQKYPYHKTGELMIVPQRSGQLNMNTFHVFDNWGRNSDKKGIARQGDSAIQHPGIDHDERKHELICQTLKQAHSKQYSTAEKPEITLYLCCPNTSCQFLNVATIDEIIAHYETCQSEVSFQWCSYNN